MTLSTTFMPPLMPLAPRSWDHPNWSSEPPTARVDEHRLRVSGLLQERWNNGRRYRDYEGVALRLPVDPAMQPSRAALEWHLEEWYEKAS